jgi:hypothetical protein
VGVGACCAQLQGCRDELWIHGHVYVFLAILRRFAPLPILTPHPGQDLHAIAHCFEHFAHVLWGIGIAVRAAVEGVRGEKEENGSSDSHAHARPSQQLDKGDGEVGKGRASSGLCNLCATSCPHLYSLCFEILIEILIARVFSN